MKKDKFDGYLICPGNSRRQINQFKRMFAKDNLKYVSKNDQYLQMRCISQLPKTYALDVNVKKENVGYFSVGVINPSLLTVKIYKIINQMAEKMFREETIYGLKDYDGLDRINKSIIGGFGDKELYPTILIRLLLYGIRLQLIRFFKMVINAQNYLRQFIFWE